MPEKLQANIQAITTYQSGHMVVRARGLAETALTMTVSQPFIRKTTITPKANEEDRTVQRKINVKATHL